MFAIDHEHYYGKKFLQLVHILTRSFLSWSMLATDGIKLCSTLLYFRRR